MVHSTTKLLCYEALGGGKGEAPAVRALGIARAALRTYSGIALEGVSVDMRLQFRAAPRRAGSNPTAFAGYFAASFSSCRGARAARAFSMLSAIPGASEWAARTRTDLTCGRAAA